MNSSKKKVEPIELRKRRTTIPVVMLACYLLLVGLGATWFLRPRGLQEQLEEAKSVLAQDPHAAERTLRRLAGSGYRDTSGVNLLLARALGRQGRWPEAVAQFRQLDPTACEFSELIELASEASSAQEYGVAEAVLLAVPTQGQQRADVLHLLIPLYFNIGEPEDVIKHCEELVRLAPNDPYPWTALAQVYDRQTQYVKAAQAIRRAVALTSGDSSALRQELVAQLIATGELAGARQELDIQLASNDPKLEVRLQHAELLRLEGKPDKAIAAVTAVLADNPHSAAARLLQGNLLLEQGDHESAIVHFQLVLQSDPFDEKAHYLIGLAYARAKRPAESEKHFNVNRRLVQVRTTIYTLENRAGREPHNADVRRELAKLYRETGRDQDAEYWLQAAQSAAERISP